MASHNTTTRGAMRTTNRSGHAAYRLDDRVKLVIMALTTMLGEPKYYGDNTDELVRLAETIAKADPWFVARLAGWCRTVANLRSVSHMLVCVVAHAFKAPNGTNETGPARAAARWVASTRGDDGTEMLATYLSLYGKPIPNSLRKGIRDSESRMSPFSVAKYQSSSKSVKMRDNLRITHPKPCSDELSEAFGACVDGSLAVPKGWETELSARGNTKEVWEELISENRLGYMALLRNLRSIVRSGADMTPVLARISDPEAVRRSRVMPFRFYTAYRELGGASTAVTRALDKALIASCDNVDRLPGRTAVLVDTSGSMGWQVSSRSVATCRDIAAVMAALCTYISDDAWACAFDTRSRQLMFTGLSPIADINMVPSSGGGTDMAEGFRCLIKSGFDADRIVVLSDNEVNRGRNKETMQHWLEEYRRQMGHDVWCHAVDLQGYGTAQFVGHHVNVMAGWSENVLRFISLVERGSSSLIGEIERFDL